MINDLQEAYQVKDELKEAIKEIGLLQQELETGANILIPVVRDYLTNLRSLRMSFATEVRDILRDLRQLNEISKTTPQIKELVINIEALKKVLNSDTIDKLKKIIEPNEVRRDESI